MLAHFAEALNQWIEHFDGKFLKKIWESEVLFQNWYKKEYHDKNRYVGFPARDIRQIQTLEGDLSDREMEQLRLGQIGITRADLFQAQQKATILDVGKFIAILLFAFSDSRY